MKGQILGYDKHSQTGVISADNGQRYNFNISEWKTLDEPKVGMFIDFVEQNTEAKDIYVHIGNNTQITTTDDNKQKEIPSRVVAGLWALFLGGLGAHKFYLGYAKEGCIMLIVWLAGLVLFGIPSFIVCVIALIEAVIYFIASNEDFEKKYVNNHKGWF